MGNLLPSEGGNNQVRILPGCPQNKGDGMMAIVLRGKMKGQVVTPSQWCNDWITIKEMPKVFSIMALQIHSWGFVSELICVITFFILDIFVIFALFNWSFIAVFVAKHLI